MDESTARQLQSMRVAYAQLLEKFPIDSYEASMGVLENPLCDLWASAYIADCESDTFLELLRYRRSHFLHDSACTVGIDAECRVVAALTVSQEILPLADLIDRLEAERSDGRVTEETLDSIDSTLIAISEGLARKEAEEFRQAVGLVTQTHLQPLAGLVEQFVRSVVSWSPPERARRAIRDVLHALNAGLTLLGQPAMSLRSKSGAQQTAKPYSQYARARHSSKNSCQEKGS